MSPFDGLDLVHSFRVLAEELSFRQAAERLNLDQSALSRRIRKLEHLVGCALFERTTRHANLTAAGRAFYSDNRTLLDGFARAVETAQAIARGHSGTMTVGYMAFAAGDLMPKGLARFIAARPHVAVTLRYASSQVQKIQLAAGEIDVGYLIGPLDHQDFASVVLSSEPLYLLLPQGHDLLQLSSVEPSALDAMPLALGDVSEWEAFRQRIQDVFGRYGIGLNVAYQSTNVLALVGLVRAGLAATILPESLLSIAPGIDARRIEGHDVRISTVLAWRSDPRPVVVDFVACARAAAARPEGDSSLGAAVGSFTHGHAAGKATPAP